MNSETASARWFPRLLPLLALAALLPPADAQDRLPEEQRLSNWFKSAVQFGQFGDSAGRLIAPGGLALGPANESFIADTGNHRIQVFSSVGKLSVAWGKRGSAPGEFLFPSGISRAESGELFVADSGNGRIQVFSPDGKLLRSWGRAGELAPERVAARGGRVAVVERRRHQVRIFTPAGEPLRTIGGFGDEPGRFRDPADAAWDADGNLYVADRGNHRIQKFDPQGNPLLQWGSWGPHPGMLAGPAGLDVHGDRVTVADTDNHRIEVFDRSGRYLFQWGAYPAKVQEGDGRLHYPSAVAVSPSGGFTAVLEPFDNRCQMFANGSAKDVRLVRDLPWWDDMHARLHSFARRLGPAGNADRDKVWKSQPPIPGAILDVEGNMVLFFDISCRPSASIGRIGLLGRRLGEFRSPNGLVFEGPTGRGVVCDAGNRRIQILHLPREGDSTNLYAPIPKAVTSFDPAKSAAAAAPDYPADRASLDAIATDSAGDLYVADGTNACILVFNYKLEFSRLIRVAPEAAAEPREWTAIGVARSRDHVYIADRSRGKVLAVDLDGKLLRSWGRGGVEAPQLFLSPAGIGVDPSGSVYVSDSHYHCITKFDAQGRFLRKWGEYGVGPDKLCSPGAILIPKADRLLVEDLGNHRGVLCDSEGRTLDYLYKGGTAGPGR